MTVAALQQDNEWLVLNEIIGLDWAADAAIDSGLLPWHFGDEVARHLYTWVLTRRGDGLPVNATDITATDIKQLTQPQHERLIQKVTEVRFETKTGTSAAYYAAKVIETGRDRRHTESLRQAIEDKRNGMPWDEAEIRHQKRIGQLNESQTDGFKTFADSYDELIAELDAPPEATMGILTGFADLDMIIGGLVPGTLIIPSAPSGGGKSAFSMNIGTNVAKAGFNVGVISAEMTLKELHRRIACSESSTDSILIRQRMLSREQRNRYANALADAKSLPIYLIDDSKNLSTIVPKVRHQHRRTPFSLIIADYTQLLRIASDAGDTREQKVASVAATLKELAMETGCAVIAPAQFNKDGERKAEGPGLNDIRESAAISHTADCVMFISPPANGDEGIATFHVKKNRGGPTDGKFFLQWKPQFTRFENREPQTGGM